MADPYAIYARHILALKPLEPVDADPGAAECGTIIHEILDSFVRQYPDDLPADALDRNAETGRHSRPGVPAR